MRNARIIMYGRKDCVNARDGLLLKLDHMHSMQHATRRQRLRRPWSRPAWAAAGLMRACPRPCSWTSERPWPSVARHRLRLPRAPRAKVHVRQQQPAGLTAAEPHRSVAKSARCSETHLKRTVAWMRRPSPAQRRRKVSVQPMTRWWMLVRTGSMTVGLVVESCRRATERLRSQHSTG